SDGRWIGETFDGVGLVKALQAQCPLDAHTRVLLVGAGGTGRAIAVALALAGVGSLVITNGPRRRRRRSPRRCGVPSPPVRLRPGARSSRRRSATSCKGEDGLGHQLTLFQVYHNFVLPHASLRQALAEPIPTHGTGSAKWWRLCTPAMAAGLTDHVWSL